MIGKEQEKDERVRGRGPVHYEGSTKRVWKVKGDPVAATPHTYKSKSRTDETAALVRSPEVRASSEEREKSREAGKARSGQDQVIVRQAM